MTPSTWPSERLRVPTQVEAFPTLREHYLGVIAKPMDLGLINHKLVNDEYEGREQFVEDLRLVFSNAVEFNRPAAQQAQSQKELNPHFVMDDLAAKTYAIATHLLNYVDHLELEYFKVLTQRDFLQFPNLKLR